MKNPMPGTSRFVIFDVLGCWASENLSELQFFDTGEGVHRTLSRCGFGPLEVRPETPLEAKIARRCEMWRWKADVVVSLLRNTSPYPVLPGWGNLPPLKDGRPRSENVG